MRDTILIADDVMMNRDILVGMLEDEYHILEAENGNEAVALLNEHKDEIVVVLLDLIMPELDGYGVLEHIKETGLLKKIPVLIITAETSTDVQKKCLSLGASDFIMKPFDNVIVNYRIKNNIELYDMKNNLEDRVEEQTKRILEQNDVLKGMTASVVDLLGKVVEYRDEDSGEHVMRVRGYTSILANKLQEMYPEYHLSDVEKERINELSVLHDIGKVGISDAILCKPGRLTREEFETMKGHTTIGYYMIAQLKGVWDQDYKRCAQQIARHHHERFDGRGYPDGLVGDDIPISAQLVSIADVYDALTHKRVYKDAVPSDRAYEMIIYNECGCFNPKLLECFKAARKEMESIR